MSEPTVIEAIEARQELQMEIAKQIREFEDRFGVMIESASFEHYAPIGGKRGTIGVYLAVRI